jgi:H+/Cl- antiporter ClcA
MGKRSRGARKATLFSRSSAFRGLARGYLFSQARLALVAAAIGACAGLASAGFLASLDFVTQVRLARPWLLAFLPLAGLAVGWLYMRLAGRAGRGTDLVIEEIHRPQAAVPLRMAPLVLLGTVTTHLFGGSAGREGTALQMAASLGDRVALAFGFAHHRDRGRGRRTLLMASLAGGFGSVFGVPLAGAVFGLEAPAAGGQRYEAIFPCFVASMAGHLTTIATGVAHVRYTVASVPELSFKGAGVALVSGVFFGLLARAFVAALHATSRGFTNKISWPPLRPLVGGAIVALSAIALGTDRPLGLGIGPIVESFHGSVPASDVFLKFAFTVVTLGSGFKGGEVTPLFFMGATGGNALARVLPLPSSLLASMGFVAVFAGAANVPITCSVMAVELFGHEAGAFAALACVASFLASGAKGIYRVPERR